MFPHNSAVYLQAGKACHVQRKASLAFYNLFQEARRFSPGSVIRPSTHPAPG